MTYEECQELKYKLSVHVFEVARQLCIHKTYIHALDKFTKTLNNISLTSKLFLI